jgi:hypothetical protein
MFETPGGVADQDQRSAEERQAAQAAEVQELERAIADDHRRRDQSRLERGYVRASLGLMRHSVGKSKE